jgi:alkaline phosphatase D
MYKDRREETKPLLRPSTVKAQRGCWVIVGIYAISVVVCMVTGLLMFVPWVLMQCPHDMQSVPDVIEGYMPQTVAFGSCLHNERPHDLLDQIHANVFVFLGDNIYADTSSTHIMNWIYNRLACKPTFQRLVRRVPYVLSVWDDHDYGKNDGGADYPMRNASQQIFLDFWRIPRESARRRDVGVYGSYRFSDGAASLLIVMLDLRSFRDPLTQCTREQGWYCPAQSGTMLGEEQWRWLEHTLVTKNANLVIIASSTQFGAQEYGYETWRNFPREQRRLASLLDPNRTVIISGDVHWGEVSLTEDGLYDITSSGISQLDPEVFPNSLRVGAPVVEFNYGLLDLRAMTVMVAGASGNKTIVHLKTVTSPFVRTA